MSNSHYDVVVVGGGFFGGILASEFDKAGKKALILEAGTGSEPSLEGYNVFLEEFYNSLIKVPNSPYPKNENALSPNALDVKKPPYSDQGYFVQEGPMPFESTYTRILGGTSLHWLGIALRMLPSDFHMKSIYDVGEDWPISYEDLMSSYARAEQGIGVAGDVGEQSYLGVSFGKGHFYPMKPIPETWLDHLIEQRVVGEKYRIGDVEAEIKVVNLPVARNSTPVDGYQPTGAPGAPHIGERCEGNASCIPICPVQAKFSSLRMFENLSSNVKVQTQSVASKILFDENGRVTGIRVKRYQDPKVPRCYTETVTADRYVLAGNAIENPRLMMASDAPDTNGLLGANLMDHPYLLTWARMPEGCHVGPFRGPLSVSGIPSLRDGKFRRSQAAFRTDIGNWGWDFPMGAPYSDVGRLVGGQGLFGAQLKRTLHDEVQRSFRLGFLLEQLPDRSNRVDIRDRNGKVHLDKLGNPRPVIYYDIGKYTQDGMIEAKRFSDWINELEPRAEDFTHYRTDDPSYIEEIKMFAKGAGHLCGTHRMGHSRGDSVVDTDCRSWEHQNLFMVGCGSMVTVGTSNPSLTGAALSYRAADTIIRELNSSGG